jgi:DNA repair exonuclease SbcCD ATPase subunit
MRSLTNLLVLFAIATPAMSQVATPPPAQATAPSTASAPILADLDHLQSAASQANIDIAHMRIEKWKADPGSKQQAQANADALQRNLTSALPGLIANYRAAPHDLNAGFKLYRNLNALYDVLASFTEAAGAFGPKNDYEALAEQVNAIDSVRRNLGDNLETLTALTQSEMNQLRMQVRTLQAQAAAVANPPTTVVVDNSEPAKKTTKTSKKKKATTNSSSTASGSNSTTSPTTSKSQ